MKEPWLVAHFDNRNKKSKRTAVHAISDYFGLRVARGELEQCIASFEQTLAALPSNPFHVALGLDFLHLTEDAAAYLVDLYREASTEFAVQAIYVEMNGFDINPDGWHCDGFAFKTAGDQWDIDWLALWDAQSKTTLELTGMEPVQKAYSDYGPSSERTLLEDLVLELTNHLVNARFMQLIAAAHESAKRACPPLAGLPVFSTAHDWPTVHRS